MRYLGRRLAAFISLVVATTIVMASFATPAYAYSNYGGGTLASPYRIATCDQLQEIDDSPSSYYVIVANIDCTGETVTAVGNFTGTLDGRNHTISNITISGSALFSQSNNATVKNLRLSSGSVSTSGNSGSFVGWAINSSLSNLHSNLTVPGNNSSWVGGIVGLLSNSTLANSSYSGTISGGVDTGGLAGILHTGSASISNSYFTGTLTANSLNAGGLAGRMLTGTITDSYSAGTINMNGQTPVGGLVGMVADGSIANSFAASRMTGSPTGNGAVFGTFDNPSSRTNLHFDQYLANNLDTNTLPCVGTDQSSGNCTARNVNNAAPSYFANNTTNAPLDTWSFTSTWTKTTSYPTLQILTSFNAPGDTPNSGDANGDGTLDDYQAHVANIKDSNGAWSTVQIASASSCTLDNTTSTLSSSVVADNGYTTKTSLDGFSVYCPTTSTTVPVTIIYHTSYSLTGLTLRYYNPTTQAWSTVPDAAFSQVTIGGTLATKVTYNLTDGGSLDQDGTANGLIVDPVALASVVTSGTGTTTLAAPDTGLPAQSAAPAIGSLILGGMLIWTARRIPMSRATKE